MMLPLKDLNPTRRMPIATYGLIAINVALFLWEQTHTGEELQSIFFRLSVVPVSVVESPFALDTFLDFIRSMFFHGGWTHLLGNMLYLWLFGDNIEDRLGIPLFLVVYFLSGFTASLSQIIIDPNSSIPLIGASGAIAGILGGYLVMFPGVRVRGIIPLGMFSRGAEWPAWAVLGMWFLLQLFNGAISLGANTAATGGVAFFAHIGGFAAGVVMIWIFMRLVPQPPQPRRREVLYERARRYRY
jgi:membrane associated rhomboid family serine protease